MAEEKNRQAVFALAVLFAINMMNFFDRQILAAVTEPIRKQWMLSDTAMGGMNTVFLLLYAAVGVPLGRWTDRGKRTRILSVCIGIWSVFTAASGLAWNYVSLFFARLGVGIGEAGCSPAGNSLIGDLYPVNKRARATSVFMLGLPVGIFLCQILSGRIVERFTPIVGEANSWKAPFWIATIPGLLLAGLALLIAEPPRGARELYQVKALTPEESPYKRVLSIPTMWWIILSGGLHNFNAYAVNAFLPANLARFHGLGLQKANTVAAFTLGAVGVVGLLGGGVLADWARKKTPNGRMLLGSIALFVLTPLIYLALSRPKGDIPAFMLLMGTGWMLFYVYYVTVYPTVQDVVEPSLRGTAMALYFAAMYVFGGAFGTLILGGLSDRFAHRAMVAAGATTMSEQFRAIGLHDAFFIVPAIALVLAFVLFAGSRTVARDMQNLQEYMRKNAETQPS